MIAASTGATLAVGYLIKEMLAALALAAVEGTVNVSVTFDLYLSILYAYK